MNILSNFVILVKIYLVVGSKCHIKCSMTSKKPVCGLDFENSVYKLFQSDCAMRAYSNCYSIEFIPVSLKSCENSEFTYARRAFVESCPAFCPEYYRPVCGASELRPYYYRTFRNGCDLEMINCRGHEDYGYVEVPLSFCQDHLMKNIFREQIIVSNLYNRLDI